MVIAALVHSWPSTGMEALQTSPAQSVIRFPREKKDPRHIRYGSATISTDWHTPVDIQG